MDKFKVLIADDHPIVRAGIKALLSKEPDYEVVGEADDGSEAVDMASQLSPDVVIMDIVNVPHGWDSRNGTHQENKAKDKGHCPFHV